MNFNVKALATRLTNPSSGSLRIAGLLLGVVGLGVVGASSLYNVPSGYRAIKFNRFVGVRDRTFNEGTHILLPWVERPIIYSMRMDEHIVASRTGSKDLQMVDITLRTLFRPDPDNLPTIYRTIGNKKGFAESILESIGNEVLKSVVAQFTASQLVIMREQVSQLIRKRLVERAADFHIELDDVSIINLSFGKEYSQAIERKQVALQEVERVKFVVEEARQKKLEIIARAEGEAIAARKFNEQLRSDPNGNFLAFKRIEAAVEIAKVLSASNNKVYLNADNLMFNLLAAMDQRHAAATTAAGK